MKATWAGLAALFYLESYGWLSDSGAANGPMHGFWAAITIFCVVWLSIDMVGKLKKMQSETDEA